MADRFVIVGGGLAGASAATELRKQGFDGEVLLIARRTAPALHPAAALEGLPRRLRDPRQHRRASGRLVRARTTSSCGSASASPTSTVRPTRVTSRRRHLDVATTGCCSRPGSDPRSLPIPGTELDGRPHPPHRRRLGAPARRARRRRPPGGADRLRLDRHGGGRDRPHPRQRGHDPRPRPDPVGGRDRRRTRAGVRPPPRGERRRAAPERAGRADRRRGRQGHGRAARSAARSCPRMSWSSRSAPHPT